MNKTVKIEKKNNQGKLIVKEIDINLLPMYMVIGWTKCEEKKTFKPMSSRVEENE